MHVRSGLKTRSVIVDAVDSGVRRTYRTECTVTKLKLVFSASQNVDSRKYSQLQAQTRSRNTDVQPVDGYMFLTLRSLSEYM